MNKCVHCSGEIKVTEHVFFHEAGRAHAKPIDCIASLTARLAAAEAENERLTRWRNLAVAAATAGAEQEVFKRFAESEAIQPIIQAWKDKVASVEQCLAAAEALWETAVQFEGQDWADHIAQSLEAEKGGRDE